MSTVRARHAGEFGCSNSSVEVQTIEHSFNFGTGQYVASGCGTRAVYVCDQRTCVRNSDADPEFRDTPQSTQQAPSLAPVSSAGGEARPSTEGEEATDVRRRLDGNAEAILACVSVSNIGVQVTWDASGQHTVSAVGELAGTAEEACIRAVLDQEFAGSVSGPGRVVHVVRLRGSNTEAD